jgi:hypothetical protein
MPPLAQWLSQQLGRDLIEVERKLGVTESLFRMFP